MGPEAVFVDLARDRAEDAPALGLFAVQDHDGVVVEADGGAVRPAVRRSLADDDGFQDLLLLHALAGFGDLDRHHDDVADAGIAPAGPAERLEPADPLWAGVVANGTEVT